MVDFSQNKLALIDQDQVDLSVYEDEPAVVFNHDDGDLKCYRRKDDPTRFIMIKNDKVFNITAHLQKSMNEGKLLK